MAQAGVVIITGVSGSGKTTAMRVFEDSGYYCVDNMPVRLVPEFLDLCENATEEISRVALVVDVREREFLKDFKWMYDRLRDRGVKPFIIYLDASDEKIKARFKETRRRHPLVSGFNMEEVLRKEREALSEIKELADVRIDTSDINIHQLRERLVTMNLFAPANTMQVYLISFGFKYGIPTDADMIVDVRCLPNPFFKDDLRAFNGNDERVKSYVLENDITKAFLERLEGFFEFAIPLYEREGKSIFTLAFGCTGGKHRSVVIVNYFREKISSLGRNVQIFHRDIEK